MFLFNVDKFCNSYAETIKANEKLCQRMRHPMDSLSELATCCGLGGRRRDHFAPSRNYYYCPSTAQLDVGNGWPYTNHYRPQPQPYLLLTQPVIIAGNPAPTNTMTLLHHAQTAHNTSTFPTTLSIIGAPTATQHQPIQPGMVSSQYAIYSQSAALNSNANPTMTAIYEPHGGLIDRNQASINYVINKPMLTTIESIDSPLQSTEKQVVQLNSEVFRQLEVIEKQVDLSKDMDLIEMYGIVITRPLNPYSLQPHITESTLKRYHSNFLLSDDYIIRFIEIIKKPGQTLGLYIRNVQFEDPKTKRTRDGLVITKIDIDSPIYNSKVLHVGDEILSVNLVDIQGMSLDDVVIIMSIPKRLVLALRIPRDRDHRLSTNLMHRQQQFLTNSIEQSGSIPEHQPHRTQTANPRDDQYSRQTSSVLGMGAMQSLDCGLQYDISHDDGLRRAHRAADMDRELSKTQPVRVQTALQVNEGLLEDMNGENQYLSEFSNEQPRRYSSAGQWPIQNYDRSTTISTEEAAAATSRGMRPFPLSIREQRLVLDRQPAMSKSRDDLNDDSMRMVDDRFQNFAVETDLDTPTGGNMLTQGRSSMAERNQASYMNDSNDSQMPSTLPKRTLPTRPSMVTSPHTTIKQPILSNIRLGDTPEQSSYFSSSIDAINRELKELRRQRMALSGNEHSFDSGRAGF